MAITFTPEQQQVIELHDSNILVSAAAGSGKTAVLVERIIRMICDEAHPVDIDRLLIVTFTNAAAAEMRERIAAGISDRLMEHPESEHLQRQATLLHNAQITTIDSFSLFLLRNHFNEIGLDPAFRVADEGEIKLLQQDVLGELLEDSFAGGDEAFPKCVEYFCPGGRERVLEQHILNLSRYAASFPWPSDWLLERKADYGAMDVQTLLESDYGQYLYRHVKSMLEGCAEKAGQIKAICETPDGPYMYGEMVEQEWEQLQALLNCENLEEYAAKVPAVSFGRLPSKKDDSVSVEKRELVKAMRGELKKTLQDIQEKFFLTPLSLAVEQGGACMGPVSTLIDLVLEFDRRMQEKKREKKLVDFSDMEHFALDILLERVQDEQGVRQVHPSAVAKEYRAYFHEILIDEYQDSNLVQEYLLWAVSGEEEGRYNRFMVGDVKQSIYKFRLARPELFLEKYETYQSASEEAEGRAENCRRIDLARNFRSRVEVIDVVNEVFSRIMSKEIGGIAYDEAAALYPGAVYPDNPDCVSELLLMEKPHELNGKQAEALAIAQKIKELRAHGLVTDKATGQLRQATYRDMVILLRTTNGWDEEFKEVLTAEGIPVYITSKTGYFAATEVQTLLQFLRVLDNPRQDIPLYGVMQSVFGGFTEEEIATVRAGHKKMSLYEALVSYASGSAADDGQLIRGELVSKVSAFLEKIEHYRAYTVYMPIRELLQTVVNDHDYLNYVTALPAGSKRRANVEMLFTKASDFEKTSYFGLFHFIRYMEQLEKYDVDFGEADLLDEHADVVRIMSIHKSKGLEFPITFVAGLGKRFNMQDVNASLLVDMDLGLACDYVDAGRRIRNKTLRRAVLSRKLREDNLAEELRVLYVALTRAKEKLILTGTLEDAQNTWDTYREIAQERLNFLDFMEAGSFLDLLLPILPQTGIKVSVLTEEELGGEQLLEAVGAVDRRMRLERAGELADSEMLQNLRTRFAYRYPYQGLEKLYTKTTVSELKIAAMADADEQAFHTFEEKEIVPYIPSFKKEESKVSGTVRGNAFHRTMELMDFDRLMAPVFAEPPADYAAYRSRLEGETMDAVRDSLRDFLREKLEDRKLSQEYFEALNEKKLLHFLQSQIAYRMWIADRRGALYREQPFVYGVSAGRLGEEFPPEETVLIQGIIDVFFVEDGEIVLLDYKTDVIDSMEALWNRYRVQLQYYEEALQSLMGMPVKEKVLYSFYLEKEGMEETATIDQP